MPAEILPDFSLYKDWFTHKMRNPQADPVTLNCAEIVGQIEARLVF
jgi:hypothetical protein